MKPDLLMPARARAACVQHFALATMPTNYIAPSRPRASSALLTGRHPAGAAAGHVSKRKTCRLPSPSASAKSLPLDCTQAETGSRSPAPDCPARNELAQPAAHRRHSLGWVGWWWWFLRVGEADLHRIARVRSDEKVGWHHHHLSRPLDAGNSHGGANRETHAVLCLAPVPARDGAAGGCRHG